MSTALTLSKWILFVLGFLSYTFAHVNGHPNRALTDSEFKWSPKESEDDVGFRSLSYGRVPLHDEFDDENDFNDIAFDETDEDEHVGLPSIANNKRSPNSVQDRSFKNKAGFYLIEGQHHTVTGTTNVQDCNRNGVFLVGKTDGINFFKNKVSGWYLAIDNTGRVYMTPDKSNADTNIRTWIGSNLEVSLYRLVVTPDKQRFFLDISPQSGTVQQHNRSDTTKFHVRFGAAC